MGRSKIPPSLDIMVTHQIVVTTNKESNEDQILMLQLRMSGGIQYVDRTGTALGGEDTCQQSLNNAVYGKV